MKHVYGSVLEYPQKKGLWYRERNPQAEPKGHKTNPQTRLTRTQPPVLISKCNVGDHVLNLTLFCTNTEPFEEWLEGHLPTIWGYQFAVYDEKECIYSCSLHNNMHFDTTDIGVAERAAEHIWNCMNFSKSIKGMRLE